MAVTTADLTTSLMLKMKVGVDEKENDVYKTLTFRKVKVAASDQDIFEVAQGIEAVLKYPVEDMVKSQTKQLISQE